LNEEASLDHYPLKKKGRCGGGRGDWTDVFLAKKLVFGRFFSESKGMEKEQIFCLSLEEENEGIVHQDRLPSVYLERRRRAS
jgi:hypothetical protein